MKQFGAKPCAAYDKNGQIIAIADSEHELAKILGITASAVSHSLHRGYKRYSWIEENDDDEE